MIGGQGLPLKFREVARLGICLRWLAPCTERAPSTEQEAAKAWKHAWEEAETEYAEKETKLANQLETDRLKLEHDLAEVTKSKEEEFEELIREEVERREVRARAPTLPCPLQTVHPLTSISANADLSPLLAQTELPAMRDELSRLSAQWEGRLWKAHEHEKQALERQRIELNGDAAA